MKKFVENPIVVTLGIVSSLLAIFIFVTGYENLSMLFERNDNLPSSPESSQFLTESLTTTPNATETYFKATIATKMVLATPHYGPEVGVLTQLDRKKLAIACPNTNTADFVAQVTFMNSADIVDWYYGIYVRTVTALVNDFELRVDSTGDWSIHNRNKNGDQLLSSGIVPTFDNRNGGANTINLGVIGNNAYFSINGKFLFDVELLPHPNDNPDVCIFSGMRSDNLDVKFDTFYFDFFVESLSEE